MRYVLYALAAFYVVFAGKNGIKLATKMKKKKPAAAALVLLGCALYITAVFLSLFGSFSWIAALLGAVLIIAGDLMSGGESLLVLIVNALLILGFVFL